MAYLQSLEQVGARYWHVASAVALALVGILDALTGSDVAMGLFYLLPVSVATWFGGRRAGLLMCAGASALWLAADVLGNPASTTGSGVHVWNALVRLGMFAAVSLLLPSVKALRHERELARIDPLTGAANRRRLSEAAHQELLRSRRYGRPMTVAFVDLDGFKAVNDQLGHLTGDRVLRAVADTVRQRVRQTDLVARVGGDEFVLLLPEIDQDAARILMPKVREALDAMVAQRRWPVTFSIGVLTWRGGSVEAEELITLADRLMYDIKHTGKNAIAYAVHGSVAQQRPDPIDRAVLAST
jgi:diguanylate cyclase (GGDEF)-like protein